MSDPAATDLADVRARLAGLEVRLAGLEARLAGLEARLQAAEDQLAILRLAINRWTLLRTPAGWRIRERTNRVLDGSPASHAIMRAART